MFFFISGLRALSPDFHSLDDVMKILLDDVCLAPEVLHTVIELVNLYPKFC